METKNAAIAVFADHEQAEAAIRSLQSAGIDMKKLSIVGKDFHTEEHALGFYNLGDRMKVWGKLGAFWGSIGVTAEVALPTIVVELILGTVLAVLSRTAKTTKGRMRRSCHFTLETGRSNTLGGVRSGRKNQMARKLASASAEMP